MNAKLVKESLDEINGVSFLEKVKTAMIDSIKNNKWAEFGEDRSNMWIKPIDVNHSEDMPWLNVRKINFYARWFSEADVSRAQVYDETSVIGGEYHQKNSPYALKLYERPKKNNVTMVVSERNWPAFLELLSNVSYEILDAVDRMTGEDAYGD